MLSWHAYERTDLASSDWLGAGNRIVERRLPAWAGKGRRDAVSQ